MELEIRSDVTKNVYSPKIFNATMDAVQGSNLPNNTTLQ